MKALLAYSLLMLANVCLANDSVVYLGAGGIEFRKTNDISMEKEVLTISRKLIRVEYEFLNTTSKPIKETISFPMPFYGFDHGCSFEHRGELQGFKVWVNGAIQPTSRTAQARIKGNDVTGQLKKLGFTDEDIAEYRGAVGDCGGDTFVPEGAIAKNKDALIRAGLMNYSVENPGVEFPTQHIRPLWETAYYYSWVQEFPPMKKVRVVHEYAPFTGGGHWKYDFTEIEKGEWTNHLRGYCITNGTIKYGKKIQSENNIKGFYGVEVRYVLSTGANWAGPIKDFTLNLKKEGKNEIASLCFDDGKFRKSNELTLSSQIKNFTPKNDIYVIFFRPPESIYE